MVEQVVIETKEALPEPTLEELEATAAFQREMERKRRKQKIQLIRFLPFIACVSCPWCNCILRFYSGKDTLFRYQPNCGRRCLGAD